MDKFDYMRLALDQASIAAQNDEVPIGAVAVYNGDVIAVATNRKEATNNATAHAEIELIAKVCRYFDNWYLENVDIYVTLEPCAMCVGAMINSRIRKLYFGAYEQKFGCVGSVYNLLSDNRFNHTIDYEGGIMEKECAEILSEFFKDKRTKKKAEQK